MAESDQQERTEEATQQRREDFRKRGQVAQTRELASVLMLLSMAVMLWFLGRFFLTQVSEILTQSLGQFTVTAARSGDMMPAASFVLKRGFLILAPFFGILAIMSVASTVLQVGLLSNEEVFDLKFERLNPVDGFKRIFSLRSVLEGFKSTLKVILIGAVVFIMVKDKLITVPWMVNFSIEQVFTYTGDLTVRVMGGIGVFMGIIAAFDYFYQRWDLERQMKMTKQEIKEEHKSREGDPLIKARIRRIQREMANKRMMTEVPKADVIITNPTHIACALQYDPQTMPAPKLLAKGSGLIAEKIKELARQHNIPIVENKPLARTMFKTLKIGQIIPRELFTAVAQVLSYVYRLKRKVIK